MFAKQNDFNSLKLIDFGLSAKYNNRETVSLTDKCGTAIFMAPEVFSHYQYSKVIFLLLQQTVCRSVECRNDYVHANSWKASNLPARR